MGGTGTREHPRFAVEAAVDVRLPDGASLSGATRNLSRGGVCLELDAPAPPGTDVAIHITLVFEVDTTSEPLALPARVAWSTPMGERHQIGCQFLALTREQLIYLDMFLRDLDHDAARDDAAGGDSDDSAPSDLSFDPSDADPFGR